MKPSFRVLLPLLISITPLWLEASLPEYDWQPFQKVVRPEVPNAGEGWKKNVIDSYVAEKHEEQSLQPRPETSKATWLRRVYLNLIGLSPTPEEQEAFLEDESEDAYEKVVEDLLSRPAHGERWGRHWMDIWRYSDWAGYKKELRDSQRHIWHWRDWIIEALNEDIGYDQMIREMFAADELYPEDAKKIRATGYLARNYYRNRNQWLDNVVTHTSQGFLGITLGCAKCHEHMYDNFTMEDYYAFRAVFESYQVRTDRVPGELDVMKLGMPRAYDSAIKASTFMFDQGDERYPLKDKAIPPGRPAIFGGKLELKEILLPTKAFQPDRRDFVIEELRAQAQKKLDAAKSCLEKEAAQKNLNALEALLAIEKLEDQESEEWKASAQNLVQLQRENKVAAAKVKLEISRTSLEKAITDLASAEEKKNKTLITRSKKAKTTAEKAIKGAQKALDAAEKKLTEKPSTQYTPREVKKYPNRSSGRRTAFANWLTDKKNPLTARVAVNHIWLRHFGQAIVPSVNEFGSFGKEPSHPALLDWLASEFMENGWSMKKLHKEIVLSATYRMSSTPDEDNAAIDPDNQFLWRMPSRRMEGEIVRDNLLHIAGTLDTTMGGPDIPNTEAQTSKRRSIYLRHAHEKLVEFVQIFDGPKVTECYQRDVTVQPHQALALANSKLTFDQAKVLAKTLNSESCTKGVDFVRNAFLHILSREPKPEEQKLCMEFLQDGNKQHNLLMVLFNHNDFITIR